jgi:hypothetical protein
MREGIETFRRGLHSFFVTGPKMSLCIEEVLMLELSKTPKVVLAPAPR